MQGAWVQSLVGELIFHMLHSVAQIFFHFLIKKNNKQVNVGAKLH